MACPTRTLQLRTMPQHYAFPRPRQGDQGCCPLRARAGSPSEHKRLPPHAERGSPPFIPPQALLKPLPAFTRSFSRYREAKQELASPISDSGVAAEGAGTWLLLQGFSATKGGVSWAHSFVEQDDIYWLEGHDLQQAQKVLGFDCGEKRIGFDGESAGYYIQALLAGC